MTAPNAAAGLTLGAAPVVVARRDPGLSARVLRATPMRYAAGADPALDRPAHVRAGSGVARVRTPAGERLAVVQDDAHFLALVDPATGLADAVTLPAGVGGRRQFETARGNKHHKLDLEACVVVPDPGAGTGADGAPLLLAFGSGSTPARERVVIVRGLAAGPADAAEVTLADASALYAALRARRDFAGAELNVEGAALVGAPAGPAVRLFARGNGAGNQARDAAGAPAGASATCDLALGPLLAYIGGAAPAPAPPPDHVARYDLGTISDEPLGFTDAAPLDPLGDAVLYLAAAESSADVVADGPVAGSAVGVIAAGGRAARWTPLVDAAGAPLAAKAEGVAVAGPGRLWVVLDVDDPDAPSLLCEVAVEGLGRG